jgi:hypothetical protein
VVIAAILMNPPLTEGAQTHRALQKLSHVRGDDVIVTNLLGVATRSFSELSAAASLAEPWLATREALRAAIGQADELHAAWGVSKLEGEARRHLRAQLSFLAAEATAAAHTHIWTLFGEPRHPSRWHQFLSDRHGRVASGPMQERIRQALQLVHIDDLGLAEAGPGEPATAAHSMRTRGDYLN